MIAHLDDMPPVPTVEDLIKDACLAIETISLANAREGGESSARSSAEWLEQIACRIGEILKEGEP